jgi:DNA-binding XRE family transcriptional regulator
MSKTFDYKILKIEEIQKERSVQFLSKPFKYCVEDPNDSEYPMSKFLVKTKEILTSKIFLMSFGMNVWRELSRFYKLNDSKEKIMYNTVFSFEPKKIDLERQNISYIEKDQNNSYEICSEIGEMIGKNINLSSGVFDENIFTPYFVDESWLDEPVVYGSICTKCSRDYPWVPQDPEYVCYGCKIGY